MTSPAAPAQAPTPSNLPIISADTSRVGAGWVSVPEGALVRTWYMVWTTFTDPQGWYLSSFWTHDGYHNAGRALYRRPVSARAWVSLLPALARKGWRRLAKALHFTH